MGTNAILLTLFGPTQGHTDFRILQIVDLKDVASRTFFDFAVVVFDFAVVFAVE